MGPWAPKGVSDCRDGLNSLSDTLRRSLADRICWPRFLLLVLKWPQDGTATWRFEPPFQLGRAERASVRKPESTWQAWASLGTCKCPEPRPKFNRCSSTLEDHVVRPLPSSTSISWNFPSFDCTCSRPIASLSPEPRYLLEPNLRCLHLRNLTDSFFNSYPPPSIIWR